MANSILFTNNAVSTLAGSLTNVATTVSVAAGTGALFPALSGGDYFRAVLVKLVAGVPTYEFIKVTARSTDALTFTRAEEGSTALTFSAGDRIELRLSKQSIADLPFAALTGGTITGLTSFGIRSTGAAYDLTIASTEVFTAGRTLTVKLNDAPRTIDIAGALTTAAAFTTAGAFAMILRASAATDVTLPTTGTLATLAGTETLTNKRVTERVSTTASSATPTPNADTDDLYTITALATAPTFGAPTGTPTNGQKLMVRIKDNGTARALAYNAIYRASSDLALPSTTVINKTLYLGFIYNSADTKWDLVASMNNF